MTVARKRMTGSGNFLPKGGYVLPSTPGQIAVFAPGGTKTANQMLALLVEATQMNVVRVEPRQVMLDPTDRAIFGYLWYLGRGDVTRLVPWLYAKRGRSVFAHKLAATVLAAFDVSEAAR